jgi:nucleotide-binding universal stress UspA family protein
MENKMKVLVGVDGSEFGRAALEKCLEFCGEPERLEIRLMTVSEPTAVMVEPWASSAQFVVEMNRLAHDNAESCIKKAEEELLAKPFPAGSVSKVIGMGSPGRAIVEEAENWGADLIVVGSHGYGFWKRAFLGSVSNSVLHNANCSVLVVRSQPAQANGQPQEL